MSDIYSQFWLTVLIFTALLLFVSVVGAIWILSEKKEWEV